MGASGNAGNQEAALPAPPTGSISAPVPVFTKMLITAALAAALPLSALAQSRRSAAPPPVVSQAIAVPRGEKVTVPLAIHGSRGELLEFIIRTPPSFGKLSAIRSTGMNSALVTYTPGAKKAPEDRFSYAVRSSEGVSAAGVIAIRFVDPVVVPAKLKAPRELEFPPLFLGERSTAELEIGNEGGGFLEGEVEVSEPWSVEGLKLFKVAAGQKTVVRLAFTPAKPGEATGEAIITGTERKVVLLRATADERLKTSPAQLKLTAQPGSHTRTGVLKISNRSGEDATVTIEAGARLLTDRSVKVAARSESSVPIFADAASGAAFDETVKLTSGSWSANIPVHAAAVGPILKFASAEVSFAGTVSGAGTRGSATLENSGGEALTVRLDIDPPFDVEQRVVTAPAHGKVEIPVTLRGKGSGSFRGNLKAHGDGGFAVVPVKAEIAEAAPEKPAGQAAPPVENVKVEAPAKEPEQQPQVEIQFPEELREVPNALGRFARATGTTTATLEWPASLGPVNRARVEERKLSLSGESRELQIGWAALAEASITPGEERATAELRGLKPGTLYTVRVVNGNDADAFVLFTADFWTAPKAPFVTPRMRTGLFVAALFALLVAIWRARRAQLRKLEKSLLRD